MLFLTSSYLNDFLFSSSNIPPPADVKIAARYSVFAAQVLQKLVEKHPVTILKFEEAVHRLDFKEAADIYLEFRWLLDVAKLPQIHWVPGAKEKMSRYIRGDFRAFLDDAAEELFLFAMREEMPEEKSDIKPVYH